jgi:hypothetical protein
VNARFRKTIANLPPCGAFVLFIIDSFDLLSMISERENRLLMGVVLGL